MGGLVAGHLGTIGAVLTPSLADDIDHRASVGIAQHVEKATVLVRHL
jgi:hypothetical protein